MSQEQSKTAPSHTGIRQNPGFHNISTNGWYPATVGWSASQTSIPPPAATIRRFEPFRSRFIAFSSSSHKRERFRWGSTTFPEGRQACERLGGGRQPAPHPMHRHRPEPPRWCGFSMERVCRPVPWIRRRRSDLLRNNVWFAVVPGEHLIGFFVALRRHRGGVEVDRTAEAVRDVGEMNQDGGSRPLLDLGV